MEERFISVVMPVYNRHRFIADAVASVLAQDYQKYELIIVDDGSTDGKTIDLLREQACWPEVQVFFCPHRGPGGAVNFGAAHAAGDYFCRIDSDDRLTPDALAVLNRYLDRFPEVSYFYSARYVIDADNRRLFLPELFPHWMDDQGRVLSVPFDRGKLLKQFHCNHLICYRREDFLAVGGMEAYLYWGEDYDVALKMSHNYRFRHIDEPLYELRFHGDGRLNDEVSEAEKQSALERIQKRALIERIGCSRTEERGFV